MYFVSFKTDAPLSHIQRALDELGRAGFALSDLHVTDDKPGRSCVRLHYRGDASVGPETYQARLERMPGVWGVQGGTLAPQVHSLFESA